MRSLSLLILILISPTLGLSDPIKLNRDSSGRIIFEAGKNAKGEEAELPQLQRENLSEKIQKTIGATPETCLSRGGIDCRRGRDPKDGSAYCLDGFADVALQYHEVCGEARLEITSERFLDHLDKDIPQEMLRPKEYGGSQPARVVIHVRNLNGVKATGVRASGEVAQRRIPGSGPESIEPYSLEEFEIPVREELLPPFADFRRKYKTLIQCANCESVKRSPK